MKVRRTPDALFEGLPDFPWAPRYLEIPSGDGGTLRVAYVDEGPREAPVVVMLHGEPTWSFLYRKVIRVVTAAGLRAVAPDLVGFGRSDKPRDRADYTYLAHVNWLRATLDGLDLGADLTLLCQDWGGLLGLRIAGEDPARFRRIVAANTFLPTGDRAPGDAFLAWQRFSQEVPELPIGRIVASGCARPIAPEIVAAYDAPFPDETYKAGARAFPMLVPISPADPAVPANRHAWEGLTGFDRPFLTVFGDSDPLTTGADRALQKAIPGAKGRAHATLASAGHFLQEDAGDELGARVAAFVRAG